jgi:hypothetical protein
LRAKLSIEEGLIETAMYEGRNGRWNIFQLRISPINEMQANKECGKLDRV